MKINGRFLALFGGVVVTQILLAPRVAVLGSMPDFVFLLVVYYALSHHLDETLRLAYGVGLCRDLLVHSTFGLETAVLVCAACLVHLLMDRFDRRSMAVQIAATFFFSFLCLILYMIVFGMLKGAPGALSFGFDRSLLISVYTAVLSPLVFRLFDRALGERAGFRQYELF